MDLGREGRRELELAPLGQFGWEGNEQGGTQDWLPCVWMCGW